MFLVPMTRNASELRTQLRSPLRRQLRPLLRTVRATARQRSPALDVAESDRAYTVKLDLPGVAKEDVKVAIDGRRVSVEAQARKDEEKKEGDRVVYRERSLASYARSFSCPADVDQAESGAKFENGVLTLTLAKRGAPASAQITVN